MADEQTLEMEEPQVPDVADDSYEIEVVEEGAEVADPTLELQAQIAELQQQNAVLQTAPPAQSQAEMLAKALNDFKQSSAPPVVNSEPAPIAIDWEAKSAEHNKKFFDNPSENVLGLVTPLFQQMQAQYKSESDSKSVQISKLSTLADESSKGLYGKYADEVEGFVKADTTKDGTIYQRALNKVKMSHFDELLAEQVEAKLEAAIAKATGNVADTTNRIPFTQATLPAGKTVAASGNKLRITPAQNAMVDKLALTKGMTREAVIDTLRDAGRL